MPKTRKRKPSPKVCAEPGCPELSNKTYCVNHNKQAWADARKRRPRKTGESGWSEQRRNAGIMVMHKGVCHICGERGSDRIDHVIPLAEGGADDASNLRPIHSTPCHSSKTRQESVRGQRRARGEA